MDIKILDLAPRDQYKLLAALVMPRPIALVTTRGPGGVDNAAPFSFFNAMGEDPPVLVLGLQAKGDGSPKDTAANIHGTGEFVVNLVDETIAQAMATCAVEFPGDVSEIEAAGLTLAPSADIAPGRVLQSPASFECRLLASFHYGSQREIVVGKVVRLHVRDGLIDPANLSISETDYNPIGRLFASGYCYTRDRFDMPVPSHDDWLAARAAKANTP